MKMAWIILLNIIWDDSGLNQWNAGGRIRSFGEVYIPIPSSINKKYPNFFPKRDEIFDLRIPTGEILKAKVCQDNSKALMTNPNNALSEWLLRKTLKIGEGELATMERLIELDFDSVVIRKDSMNKFTIDKAPSNSFEQFINS